MLKQRRFVDMGKWRNIVKLLKLLNTVNSIHQPMPQGDDGCLGAVGDAELSEDTADVVANGTL
jgi:hypothetical protein